MRRGNAVGAGDSGPYFFFSYRHTPRFDEHDETDPDVWAAKLYRDLCGHLFQISSLPLSDRLGFMDRELRPGDEWPMRLAVALATCRVFVPLYSPRYFSSEHCGREWSAFAERAAGVTARGPLHAEAIIPALWAPVRPGQLPEAAQKIHYLFGDYGSAYATHGFYRLMRLSKYRDDYEEAVFELARRIADVAENSSAPADSVTDYDSLVNAFATDGRRRVVGVSLSGDQRRPKPAPLARNVPARNTSFTGRDQVLDRLREQLSASGGAAAGPVALRGPAGVGKTEVAVEFAHRFTAEYDVIWRVPAEQRELINPALAELAAPLGLRVGESITDTAQAVREALRRGSPSSRWLIIFDNADDPDELTPFFPGGPGQVLVTSGNPGWSRVGEPVEIDVFSRAESMQYLQRRVPALSSEDAGAVAELLGDLPLAIEQASAWLAETAMPAAGYVARLNDQFGAGGSIGEPLGYPPSVAATLRLSFDRLRERSPAAARVLELCAYFAPEPVSLSLLYSDAMTAALVAVHPRLRERDVMGELLRDIERYSLARVDLGGNSIQVHRLIQAGIRAQMAPQRYREEAMHEVHLILAGARPRQGNADDPLNWALYDLIWPHLGPSQAYECDSADIRQLLIDRVRYLWRRGEFKAALELGERLEAQWTRTIGPHHRQTLYLRFHVANVLRSQGRFPAAYDLDTAVFTAQREVLGADDPNTLQTAGSLGGDLRALGSFRDALELDEQTYRQLTEMMGADHPSALSAANNLAVDLRLVGDCVRARDIDLDTLSQRERVLGSDHPYTLHSASMLARDLREAGDYTWSIELLRGTHRRCRTVLGEDSDALALADRTLSALSGVLGERHPFTLSCAVNKAGCLHDDGQLHAAEALLRQTLERFSESLGRQHLDTLICGGNLAVTLHAQGRTGDANLLRRQVIAAMEPVLGEEHPSIGALRQWRLHNRDLEVQPT